MFDRRSFLTQGAALGGLSAFPLGLSALPLGLAVSPLDARGLSAIPAPMREAMVPVSGGRVYVRINGHLTGRLNTMRPPLIIAHGGPGGIHAHYLNALALADERAVILYDQLDSGLSDHPNDPRNWRVERFVDELDRIRQYFGIRRWHVLGHSWGGTIALEYGALRRPAIAGLILASPLVSTRSWLTDAAALRRQLPADDQQRLVQCDPPAPITPLCESATRSFYRAFNGREPAPPSLMAYAQTRPRLRPNRQIYEAMWGTNEFVATGTLKNYDGEPLLGRLDGQRTLFVCGQYDEARPVTTGDFARRAGADFAVIPGAAHGLFTDRPEETLGILRPWLREHDRA